MVGEIALGNVDLKKKEKKKDQSYCSANYICRISGTDCSFSGSVGKITQRGVILSVQCQMSPCGILKPSQDCAEKYFFSFCTVTHTALDCIKRNPFAEEMLMWAAKWERFSVVHC